MHQAAPGLSRHNGSQWLLRLLVIALLAIALVLNYRMWLAQNSEFKQIQQLHVQIDQQNLQNSRLQVRNNGVKADIESLRQGLDAIEERARFNLNMIREGETLYRIFQPDADADADAGANTRQ